MNGKRYGVEVKYSDAPNLTKSMHTALADLTLERLWVVYPGRETIRMANRIEAVSLAGLLQALRKLVSG